MTHHISATVSPLRVSRASVGRQRGRGPRRRGHPPVRRRARRRQPQPHRRPWGDDRAARPQRRGQDNHDLHAPRPVRLPTPGSIEIFGSAPGSAAAHANVGAMLQDGGMMPGVQIVELLAMIRSLYPAPLDARRSHRHRAARWPREAAGRSPLRRSVAAAPARHGAHRRSAAAHPRRAHGRDGCRDPARLLARDGGIHRPRPHHPLLHPLPRRGRRRQPIAS